MPPTLLANRRIAILEDDHTNRERWWSFVTMCGAVPVLAAPHAPALVDLEAFLTRENVSMIMCDHRLFEGNYATYSGAEAVAASYRSGRGGVLITSYESDDAEVSIREYRRWIPALVHATGLGLSVLQTAMLQADREVRQHLPAPERIPYRTIMTIKNLVPKGDTTIVKVVMSQWDPEVEVGFPVRMLPESMRAYVAPGSMLIAEVNLEADRPEDLFFDKFELPDPDVLRRSETIVDRS